DLLKRMEKISDVSQARFMESFQSPRIYSTAESSYGKFIDPNCDSASKTLYKRAIASYLHYRFHTGEQLVPTSAYTLGHRFRVSNASITEYNVQSQPDHPIHTTRRIVLDDGPVMYRCDCPGYEQWQRCKHVVALKDIDQGQKHIQDRLF
ncbi:MAG: hypothetical protein KJ922_05155, partial [Nanoarchaeota archaeon]|nr:hypothetical protein [Nanoarchaeota archaeon]